MLALNVHITGDTTDDLELALEEALKSVRAGNTSGHNSNDTGAYRFDVSGDPTMHLVTVEVEPSEADAAADYLKILRGAQHGAVERVSRNESVFTVGVVGRPDAAEAADFVGRWLDQFEVTHTVIGEVVKV